MKNPLIIFLILFAGTSNIVFGFQDIEIKGTVLDGSSGKPIPYATVINITSGKQGTTTNEDGSFILILPQSALKDEILISSIGYKRKTFTASRLKEQSTIRLEEKVYELPDFVVTNETLKNAVIGNGKLPFFYNQSSGMSVPAPGFSLGAFLKPKRKQANGHLDSLKVFLTGKYFNTPFLLRILKPKKNQNIKESQLYPLENFDDLITAKTIHKPQQKGWYTIDLSDKDIPISKDGLFIMFIQLDIGKDYYWIRNKDGSIDSPNGNPNASYGHEIAIQKRSSHKIFDAIFTGKTLGIIEKGRSQSAMVLHYTY